MIAAILGSVGFLTIVPSRKSLSRATFGAFPLTGAAIGALLGLLWLLSAAHMSALAAGAMVILADAVITGALHLDAVADCGDGLIAHLDRSSRLRVMSDPHLGAFGAVALVTVEIARYSVFASSPGALVAMILCYGLSRSAMAIVALYLPAAKPGSLIGAFGRGEIHGPSKVTDVIIAIEVGALVLWGLSYYGLRFMVATLVGSLFGAALVLRAKYALGGVTGDVVGASGVLFETAFLLALLR